MTIKVQLKRSAVPGKIPTPADLAYGELGVNYHPSMLKLYTKGSDDKIYELGGGPGFSVDGGFANSTYGGAPAAIDGGHA